MDRESTWIRVKISCNPTEIRISYLPSTNEVQGDSKLLSGFIVWLLKPAQSALYAYGGEGGYEQPSKQSFVVYLTAKKLVQLISVGFDKTLPGFDQHFLRSARSSLSFSVQNTTSFLKLL
jgi:hypothetical protein